MTTADRLRTSCVGPGSIPSICAELGGLPTSTLYHYLHADGALKRPGHELLGEGTAEVVSDGEEDERSESA